jgi:TPP-dependent trihydroxycyclohexane-1,2-dione (THcHDO) dehydratase
MGYEIAGELGAKLGVPVSEGSRLLAEADDRCLDLCGS